MKPKIVKPKKGQESVWDYPRPPRLESFKKTIEIYFNGELIANTNHAYRVLETSHPPVYYLPIKDVRDDFLLPSGSMTHCEWKGIGSYYHLQVKDKFMKDAAWFYTKPKEEFKPLKNYLAFYAHKMDSCYINGELVVPQPGEFYGGWITSEIVGPFKGVDGSWGW